MPKSPAVNKKLLVFDTHALLTFYYNQSGYKIVQNHLKQAESNSLKIFFNEISLGELYYRVWKNQGQQDAQALLAQTYQLPLVYVPVDRQFILHAAAWKGRYAISYTDAFVVETAIQNKCPILTGDPEFKHVKEVEIVKLTD